MALKWSRKSLSTEAFAGLSFLFLLSIAFFVTVIQQDRPATKYPYHLSLFYSRIDGLKEGTEVRILGITKGYVDHITSRSVLDIPDRRYLDSNKDRAIELQIALEEPLTLWDNYKVEFQTITIFSNRVININPGSSDGRTANFKPTYMEGSEVPDYLPSAKYFDDFFKVSSQTIEDNREDLRTITSNLRSITDKMNGLEGTLPRIVGSLEMYDELNTTVSDAQAIGKEGRRYMESSRNLESTMPLPFIIFVSFYGRTTLSGRKVGPQN